MANFKFSKVPVIELDLKQLTTDKLIGLVQNISTNNEEVKKSGGYFVIRPKSEIHRFLIPDSIQIDLKTYNPSKHYFIDKERNDLKTLNSNNNDIKPINPQWVFDIPGLDNNIDGNPLLIGAHQQFLIEEINNPCTPCGGFAFVVHQKSGNEIPIDDFLNQYKEFEQDLMHNVYTNSTPEEIPKIWAKEMRKKVKTLIFIYMHASNIKNKIKNNK